MICRLAVWGVQSCWGICFVYRHFYSRFQLNSQLLYDRAIIKAHPYRRASFPEFPKVGNIQRTISIFEGVLSLFVISSRSKKIMFVKFHTFGGKNQEKSGKIWKTNKMTWL